MCGWWRRRTQQINHIKRAAYVPHDYSREKWGPTFMMERICVADPWLSTPIWKHREQRLRRKKFNLKDSIEYGLAVCTACMCVCVQCTHQIYLINVITRRKTKTIFHKWIANYILILVSMLCYLAVRSHLPPSTMYGIEVERPLLGGFICVFSWSQNSRHSCRFCGCCCRYGIIMAVYVIIISLAGWLLLLLW